MHIAKIITFFTVFAATIIFLATFTDLSITGFVTNPAANTMSSGITTDAIAAYSVRKINPGYDGPALTLRRQSDGANKNFTYTAQGHLPVQDIQNWLQGSDGEVTSWYSQLPGHPALTTHKSKPGPLLAENGTVFLDNAGRPELRFIQKDVLVPETNLPESVKHEDHALFLVVNLLDPSGGDQLFGMTSPGSWPHLAFYGIKDDGNQLWLRDWTGIGEQRLNAEGKFVATLNAEQNRFRMYKNHERLVSSTVEPEPKRASTFVLGTHTKKMSGDWYGAVSELLITPSKPTDEAVRKITDDMASYYNTSRTDYNADAILPQEHGYHIELYDWLQTLSVEDVTLPKHDMNLDATMIDTAALPDVYLETHSLTASSVTRSKPEWYVLDAGNGEGIEATGEIVVPHQPIDGNYGGNPARSWANEPAFLQHLSIPLKNGSEGNPYHDEPALCNRAVSVAIVDMLKYSETGGYAHWGDMYGKALLSWAETYRYCKHRLPEPTKAAYEEMMRFYFDRMVHGQYSPRAVNTNMDMFAIQGVADFYAAAENPDIKQRAVEAAKEWLLGNTDGELGTNHDIFAINGYKEGVYHPAGFILEGDQPDVFYGGESFYHLAGALSAVQNKETGEIPSDWAFLKDILEQMESWRSYQVFYDPGRYQFKKYGPQKTTVFIGPGGFNGRTGAGAPSGQASESWKHIYLADTLNEGKPRIDLNLRGGVPSEAGMQKNIEEKLGHITTKLSTTYTKKPKTWNGWSPWVKKTSYTPQTGWHTRLKNIEGTTTAKPPILSKETYNKAFGGYPAGDTFWAYKNNDGATSHAWFVEAMPHQGSYGGWFGGKLEAFWTEDTGVVLLNRHGKTGCDGGSEDSTCWNNIDKKAAHHVWGRDENGNAFTPLLLRGQDLQRTSEFHLSGANPSVTVKNVFNDPSLSKTTSRSGEQTGAELQGSFNITNEFTARTDGVSVTHTVRSDGTDEIAELHAALPVFLRVYSEKRAGDKPQRYLNETSIEYYNGEEWNLLPEDQDGDGFPEHVETATLRLGRDFAYGDGKQYVYVNIDHPRNVRLSRSAYHDPYQTQTSVRTVHIDLHGELGTPTTFTERKATYNLTTNPVLRTNTTPELRIQDIHGNDTHIRTSLETAGYPYKRGFILVDDTFHAKLRAGNTSTELPSLSAGEHTVTAKAQLSNGVIQTTKTFTKPNNDKKTYEAPSTDTTGNTSKHTYENTAVTEITTRKGATVRVAETREAPKHPRTTYKYLDLNASNQTNASITFTVDQDWLDLNDVEPDNVALHRRNQDWEELPTTRNGYTYTAQTPGFSYFAIAEKQEQRDQEEDTESDGGSSGGSSGGGSSSSSSSGGSTGGSFGGAPTCTPETQCGEWGACIENAQQRSCKDGCGETWNETQACLTAYEATLRSAETTQNITVTTETVEVYADTNTAWALYTPIDLGATITVLDDEKSYGLQRNEMTDWYLYAAPRTQPRVESPRITPRKPTNPYYAVTISFATITILTVSGVILQWQKRKHWAEDIKTYIKQHRGQYTDNSLQQALRKAGWEDRIINKAFRELNHDE